MPIPVAKLIEESFPIFGVCRREIVEPGRQPHIFRARAAVAVAARASGRSYGEIGRWLGGRTKWTIANALQRAEEFCASDPEYSAACEYLGGVARDWAIAHTQELLSRHTVQTIKREARRA